MPLSHQNFGFESGQFPIPVALLRSKTLQPRVYGLESQFQVPAIQIQTCLRVRLPFGRAVKPVTTGKNYCDKDAEQDYGKGVPLLPPPLARICASVGEPNSSRIMQIDLVP